MRKIVWSLVLVVMTSLLWMPLSVSAATPMSAQAKAGDAVVDGWIGNGEYGDPYVLSGANTVSWGDWGSIRTEITYRFAWSSKGLYLAITYNPSYVESDSLLQLDCNPGNQLRGSQEGLFFTIYPDHRVTLHNHRTQAGDASAAPYDLSAQVQIASYMLGEYRTTEVLLPMEAFRITNRNFTFSRGILRASAVVMLKNNGVWSTGAAFGKQIESWTLDSIGLGTLTLLPGRSFGSGAVDPDFGVDPDMGVDMEDSVRPSEVIQALGTIALIFVGIYFILGILVVILAVVLLIVLCVRRKKRMNRQ